MSDHHRCDNCGEVFDDNSLPKTLWEIHHLAERLDPGCEVPSGECKCGALTYICKDTPIKMLARAAE
jgi:hypothetical protein